MGKGRRPVIGPALLELSQCLKEHLVRSSLVSSWLLPWAFSETVTHSQPPSSRFVSTHCEASLPHLPSTVLRFPLRISSLSLILSGLCYANVIRYRIRYGMVEERVSSNILLVIVQFPTNPRFRILRKVQRLFCRASPRAKRCPGRNNCQLDRGHLQPANNIPALRHPELIWERNISFLRSLYRKLRDVRLSIRILFPSSTFHILALIFSLMRSVYVCLRLLFNLLQMDERIHSRERTSSNGNDRTAIAICRELFSLHSFRFVLILRCLQLVQIIIQGSKSLINLTIWFFVQ